MYLRKQALIAGLIAGLVLLTSCTATPNSGMAMPAPPPASAEMPAAEPVAGEITVVNATVRPAASVGGVGAAFFTVQNGLDHPVQLMSASSPVAQSTELHESVDENGVMKMIPHPEGFPVDAAGSLELKPGGKHMMLFGMNEVLKAGDVISVTLTFSPAQTIDVTMPVVDLGGDGM